MRKFVLILAAGALMTMGLAATAMADWDVGGSHKMHFPQLPDEDGWDVRACLLESVADDWVCEESGPVRDIHFWGSWLNDNVGTIYSFTITIYSDVPDPDIADPTNWSHPGEVLWTRQIGIANVAVREVTADPPVVQGWYDPQVGFFEYPDHVRYFQYNITDIPEPFVQTVGEIYWLEITADVETLIFPQPLWGWKSSDFHWNDDAVYPLPGCIAPDNGFGTVTLPADCDYTSPEEVMMIIDGLPPGTSIELVPIWTDFISKTSTPGGMLGGEIITFEMTLDLVATGQGDLYGFNRHLWVPVMMEVHIGPRVPGDPYQLFPAEIYRMYGPLFGDPDFCAFFVYGGSDYGLPCPGEIQLTELPNGDFAVESFFDVTYQIEFEGCPGSQLSDYAGFTTGTIRMEQGIGDVIWMELYEPGLVSGCEAPDNGTGTVTLPPPCDLRTGPADVMRIVDGLPMGSTLEMPAVFTDYNCDDGPYCMMGLPPGTCEGVGGILGGNGQCFDATLHLDVSGTGSLLGFTRHLAVPVFMEIHTGPRNPGDPVQSFQTDLFRLQGELFGDPDFCTFRIYAGTDYGLPGPGEMTLTELPSGDFAVESFFDITYQIEFEGCPASLLEDYAGTTTATCRFYYGDEPGEPQSLDLAFVIDGGACCGEYTGGITGNANCSDDGKLTLSDISRMIDRVYISKALLCCEANGNTNGDVDCKITLSDISKLIDAIYISKTPPEPCMPACE